MTEKVTPSVFADLMLTIGDAIRGHPLFDLFTVWMMENELPMEQRFMELDRELQEAKSWENVTEIIDQKSLLEIIGHENPHFDKTGRLDTFEKAAAWRNFIEKAQEAYHPKQYDGLAKDIDDEISR